jgi:cobalt-zinc-cadmium efflux system membrane fusion protein
MRFETPSILRGAAMGAIALIAAGATLTGCSKGAADAPRAVAPTMDKVELADSQLKAITVQTIAEHVFSPQRTAVGSIDFDEDRAVQVFSNYQARSSRPLRRSAIR